ncbi:MAG TPA: Uma2 family endonuclease [Chloroflexota bacterium]|nr:Uma2 family endonuclease [Chloroflexota bacterium]
MTTAPAYPPRSPASWAEVVPGYGPVSVDILLTMPDDGYIYEVVEGVLVRVAGSGNRATTLAAVLLAALLTFVRPRRLGRVTGADGVYKFPGAETGLIPDVGYYRADRVSLITDDDKPIPFAPDLAVEVASPSQDSDDMAAKARVYLKAGTRLVWVVWPQSGHIDVWHPGVLTGPVSTLRRSDTLDGADIIPGFSYPVADLFADPLRQRSEE